MELREGRVTTVTVEDGVCLVNVQMARSGVEKRNLPILKLLSGVTFVPDEGDMVAIQKLQGSRDVVVGILNRAPYDQPDHNTDEFSILLDEDTELSVTSDENGVYDINLSTSGVVSIDSPEVVVGNGSENVVTDIQTTTNQDGYVTDVSVETSNNMTIE